MVSSRVYLADSRSMAELEDSSVQLMVTSPPYWHIKDYGKEGQIGYGQSLHEYLNDLYTVWRETHRVLGPGRRACINIGDQFLRSSVYGRYKVVPLHAEITVQMENAGFDFMGSIIWNKRTTMRTTGGATVMGSYPYPPNGIVEIDYEHILVFRKPGKCGRFDKEIKEASRMSKDQWKELHLSHWTFGGARQVGHEAMFPVELPSRLIRMFSLVEETVLDPFIGSGTTALAANELDRNCVGYELNEDFKDIQEERFRGSAISYEFLKRRERRSRRLEDNYQPIIPDIEPIQVEDKERGPELHKVKRIEDDLSLTLVDGRRIPMVGIEVLDRKKALEYLKGRVKGRKIILVEDGEGYYVHLANRIFINKELIKNGSCSFNGDTSLSKHKILQKAEPD